MIKSFKLFEDKKIEDTSVYFKDKINYDLLQDLKDLSLDLIDDGYRLQINIRVSDNFFVRPICILNFYHKLDELNWCKYNNKMDYNSNDHITKYGSYGLRYSVCFSKVIISDKKRSSFYHDKNEIESIIQEMYPYENITF